MSPWLSIVGIGEDGLGGLAPGARLLIAQAEVLVGGDRHLAMVPEDGRPRLTWTSPLAELVARIVDLRGQRVCVLATGNPFWYGIGVTLAKHIPVEEMAVLPAPSAFALASARLGWPLAETATLTLHGRPLALLASAIQPGARILLLSDDRDTPAAVARVLTDSGYGGSRLTVFEHMGGADERRFDGLAEDWREEDVRDFNTIAIACVAGAGAALLPLVPGLPDSAYRHDGQLTKREVRAVTLAALAPVPGALLWDVGAGAGSVAIEWLRAVGHGGAIAIEHDPSRAAAIAENAAALGVPTLDIVTGAAPGALAGLAPPDAVFIGGGLGTENMFAACWAALKPGGRLVANGVTIETEARLSALYGDHGGTLTRLSVARAGAVGKLTAWQPFKPVTQWAVTKP